MHTPYAVLSLNADNREYLVFGLAWAVVIGHRPDKESVSRVREAKATHYVLPGDHSSVVGYVKFPVRKKVRGELPSTWFSAAQIFADRFANGVHAFVSPIDDEHHWFVASQDGDVIPGTDCVFDSRAEALGALEDLKKQYPSVVVATDAKLNAPSPASRMLELKHPLMALPLWMRLSACGVVAALVLGQGPALWHSVVGNSRNSETVEVAVDAAGAWKGQLDRWQKTIQVDGPRGFQALLSQIGQVPLKLGGWPLASLECLPYPVGWKCSAVYKRGAGGTSTNQSLTAALPRGWAVQWLDIDKGKTDKAKVSWALQAQRTVLDRSKLEDKAFIEGGYTSRIQAVYAAFKVAVAPKAMPAPDVPVPTYTDAEGQTVAIPYSDNFAPGSRIPKIKGLQFDGPLRSMTVLPLTNYSVIKTFTLTVADSKEPSLANSLLTASVTGVFYVQ
jgi:hypothetical protein